MKRKLLMLAALLVAPAVWAQDCDRACLEGWVDRYLDAVIDNRPGDVPMTSDVRFTENGQIRQIEAYLHQVPYGMNAGWSTYDEGMSDELQDRTGV